MVFSSPIFLFFFLPVFFLIYFILPKKIRNLFLLVSSLFFYAWGEGRLVGVMIFSMLVDYVAGIVIATNGFRHPIADASTLLESRRSRSRLQKSVLVLSILTNFLVLAVFKYADFGLQNLRAVFEVFGSSNLLPLTLGISLPLGISFYTFQSLSYTIDVYRGHAKATPNVINFTTYVTMFPQLVAGPIVRYVDVAKQIVERTVTRPLFVSGIRRFAIGLAKKVLVANVVAGPADAIFALDPSVLSPQVAWFGAIMYALQIYFDFSGYSDMAIGMGRMLGFTFLENFNFPYIATSIRDFWRRWHISLSTWFRDYVYIPLGGNRYGVKRTYLSLVFVFFVTGLWHGASWSFVVWGLFHGLFLILERVRGGKFLSVLPKSVRHVYVILVVLVGWVLFRSDSLSYALGYLGSMVSVFGDWTETLGPYMSNKVILVTLLGIIGSTPVTHWLKQMVVRVRARAFQTSLTKFFGMCFASAEVIVVMLLLLMSAMQLASGTYNPFIYFRF
jgi:alginate O-acetyltransferase complex protein AlgI